MSNDWLSQAEAVETIPQGRCRRISHTLRQKIANPGISNSRNPAGGFRGAIWADFHQLGGVQQKFLRNSVALRVLN